MPCEANLDVPSLPLDIHVCLQVDALNELNALDTDWIKSLNWTPTRESQLELMYCVYFQACLCAVDPIVCAVCVLVIPTRFLCIMVGVSQ